MKQKKSQFLVFLLLLFTYALLAFLSYSLGLQDMGSTGTALPEDIATIPAWQMGAMIAAGILVSYGLLGGVGIWLAHRLNMPGVFRQNAGWQALLIKPIVPGLALGSLFTIADRLFSMTGERMLLPHPQFPLSIIASLSAAIGEEIMFRMFVMGLWAYLLNLLLSRWGKTTVAIHTANLIAALAFAAGHLPATMFLYQVTDPMQLPLNLLLELVFLNGILGIIAGRQYAQNGLVAAAGVHFWTDIIWHVVLPPLLFILHI